MSENNTEDIIHYVHILLHNYLNYNSKLCYLLQIYFISANLPTTIESVLLLYLVAIDCFLFLKILCINFPLVKGLACCDILRKVHVGKMSQQMSGTKDTYITQLECNKQVATTRFHKNIWWEEPQCSIRATRCNKQQFWSCE